MIFDTHANILYQVAKERLEGKSGMIESYHIPELLEGNVTGGIWTYNTDNFQPLQGENDQIITEILEELEQSPNIQLVKTKDDWAEENLNVILGLKGLSMVQGFEHLEELYELGFRHANWTMVGNEQLFFGNEVIASSGLTDQGVQLVHKMNDLGMLIDVSGADALTIVDIVKTTQKPIIASNSNCHALAEGINNLTDEQIKAIAEVDGVIGITARAKALDTFAPTVKSLVHQIDYLKKLVGTRHISLGFNFKHSLIGESVNLEDCQNPSQASMVIDELMNRNYSSSEIDAIASINAKRVINKNLKGG